MLYNLYKGLMMDANFLINKLFDYYEVYTISELGDKIGVKQPIISGWKSRNSINPIKKKCRELGIYSEIFASSEISQTLHNNYGNNANELHGNQYTQTNKSSNGINKELLKLIQLASETLDTEQIHELRELIIRFLAQQ